MLTGSPIGDAFWAERSLSFDARDVGRVRLASFCPGLCSEKLPKYKIKISIFIFYRCFIPVILHILNNKIDKRNICFFG